MSDQDKSRAGRFVWKRGDLVVVAPGEQPPPRKHRYGRDRVRDRAGPVLELGEIRRARSKTQSQVADELGVAQTHVSRLESREDPQLSTVLNYLRALEVKLIVIELEFADGTEMRVPITTDEPRRG